MAHVDRSELDPHRPLVSISFVLSFVASLEGRVLTRPSFSLQPRPLSSIPPRGSYEGNNSSSHSSSIRRRRRDVRARSSVVPRFVSLLLSPPFLTLSLPFLSQEYPECLTVLFPIISRLELRRETGRGSLDIWRRQGEISFSLSRLSPFFSLLMNPLKLHSNLALRFLRFLLRININARQVFPGGWDQSKDGDGATLDS